MAHTTLLKKLKLVEKTFDELTSRLSRSAKPNEDLSELPKIAEAYCSLKETIDIYQEWKIAIAELAEAQEVFSESANEPQMKKFVATEITKLKTKILQLEKQLEILLYLREDESMKNVLLEIRALAGGDYSCLFVGDLVRMYKRYAESQNWTVTLLQEYWGDIGGFKEVILEIKGDSVYGKLKWESGVHEAEAITDYFLGFKQKQLATAMVRVMPEPKPNELQIKPDEIEIKCYVRGFYRWQRIKVDC